MRQEWKGISQARGDATQWEGVDCTLFPHLWDAWKCVLVRSMSVAITARSLPILKPRRLSSPFRGFSLLLGVWTECFTMILEVQHGGACPSLHLILVLLPSLPFVLQPRVPSHLRAFACATPFAWHFQLPPYPTFSPCSPIPTPLGPGWGFPSLGEKVFWPPWVNWLSQAPPDSDPCFLPAGSNYTSSRVII